MSSTVSAGPEPARLTRRARKCQAVVVKPEREKTMYHLAIVLYDIGNIERAKILFEQVRLSRPPRLSCQYSPAVGMLLWVFDRCP